MFTFHCSRCVIKSVHWSYHKLKPAIPCLWLGLFISITLKSKIISKRIFLSALVDIGVLLTMEYPKQIIETVEHLLKRQQINLWELAESDCLLRKHFSALRANVHPSPEADNKHYLNGILDIPDLKYLKRHDLINWIDRMFADQNIYLYELIECKIELQHRIDELVKIQQPNENCVHIDRGNSTPTMDLNVSTESLDLKPLGSTSPSAFRRQPEESFSQDVSEDGISLSNRIEVDALPSKNHRKLPKRHNMRCAICKTEFDKQWKVKAHSKVCAADGKCPHCPKILTNRNALSNHITRVHIRPNEKYKCTLCHKGFQTRILRRMHLLNVHNVRQRYPCTLCTRAFNNRERLEDHINWHNGVKAYECDICNLKFGSKSDIVEHMVTHSGAYSELCSVCGLAFSSRTRLRNHMVQHSAVKRFQCTQCDRHFAQRQSLLVHMECHSASSELPCDHCNRKFHSEAALKRHTEMYKKTKAFACDLCDYRSYKAQRVRLHRRNVHRSKTMQCSKCNRKFSTVKALQSHLQLHEGTKEKEFECAECPKKYYSQSSLLTHVQQIHRKVNKVYTCEECGATLATQGGLYNHKRTHKKPFECSVCLRPFSQASNLNQHMLTHTGEKPHPCDICGRKFRRLSDLAPHRRIHTGEKPFSCEHCERKFADKGNLRKHLKTHKT